MNSLERAQRDWETPPDEEEAEYCEHCGEEFDFLNKNDEDELVNEIDSFLIDDDDI